MPPFKVHHRHQLASKPIHIVHCTTPPALPPVYNLSRPRCLNIQQIYLSATLHCVNAAATTSKLNIAFLKLLLLPLLPIVTTIIMINDHLMQTRGRGLPSCCCSPSARAPSPPFPPSSPSPPSLPALALSSLGASASSVCLNSSALDPHLLHLAEQQDQAHSLNVLDQVQGFPWGKSFAG